MPPLHKNVDLEEALLNLLRDSINDIKPTFQFHSEFEPTLEIPKERAFGDLSTNSAMRIGRHLRRPAREIAITLTERINSRLKATPLASYVEKVDIKGPGFINFRLKKEALYYVLDDINKLKTGYGRNNSGKNKSLQIEFACANPTGPLTVAHGRQAAFGDSLANILAFSGYKVTREYYINDEGKQVNLLGESVKAAYMELIGQTCPYPEDGYRGDYIRELANVLKNKYGTGKKGAGVSFFTEFGYKALLKNIKRDLENFGVKFDVWYSQRRLTKKGLIKKSFNILKKKDLIYNKDGAVWFRSTRYGDEKDRVAVKSDGSFTYLAPDIAYHFDKFKRGFKSVINVWGPDHHGYIPRIIAAVQGLGIEPERLNCLIVQLVTLYKGKEALKISTRAGRFVTLNSVTNEVGRDVARFFFLMRKRDSHLNFDLELAKKESMDNPVYYIQYAHARISSILEFYRLEHKTRDFGGSDQSQLKEKEEFHILRVLREFPLIIRSSASGLEPYPVLSYLQELAAGFHSFYNKHRVVTADLALTKARLNLVNCVRIVLATGLKLLGVSAPAKM